jgi:hypothetical protein
MPAAPDIRDLQAALDGLIHDGTLDRDQAAKVHEAVAPLLFDVRADDGADDGADHGADEQGSGERVVEVLAYVGGALVLAAAAVMTGLAWDDIGRSGQLLVTAGGALVLLAAAAVLGGATRRRQTLRSVLAALAAGAAGLAGSVVARIEASDDAFDSTAVLYLSLGILVVAVPAYLFWRGSALVFAAYSGGFILTLWLVDQQVGPSWEAKDGLIGLVVYGLVVAGLGWLLPERDLALALALTSIAVAATIGSVDDATAWFALVLGLVVVAVAFALFSDTREGGFAAVGAISALIIPATSMATITESAVVVAVVLSVVGLALIAGAITTASRGSRSLRT